MKKVNFLLIILFSIRVSISVSHAQNDRVHDFWVPGYEYHYNAIYRDNEGNVITDENLVIKPTGMIWEMDSNQTLAEFHLNYSEADSAALAPHPLNGVNRKWIRTYKEGVIQDPHRIWMHPVRNNQYILTEIAPFPEVRFPLEKGLQWHSTLWIYEAFGSFYGTVESDYVVEGRLLREYDFGHQPCWKIIATGLHDRLGKNTAVFYFHEIMGITEMNYHFYNGQEIEIKLTGITTTH